MFGKTIFGITLLILLVGMMACSSDTPQATKPMSDLKDQPPSPQTEQVIARIGDKKLTSEQLEWISRRRGGPPPSPRATHRMAEYWMDIELLSEEARKNKLQHSEKAKFMADFGVKEAYANAMVEHIRETAKVTEQDIQDYYEKNKLTSSQIAEPPRLSFSHIRTKTLESAQVALERIKQGEDINELAKELSVYHDSKRGGKVTNLIERAVKTGYGRVFLKALQAASIGQLIGPIKTSNDFYEVAQLEGKQEGRIKPLEEVEEQLRTTLLYRIQNSSIEERLDALKKKENTEIFVEQMFRQPSPPSPAEQLRKPNRPE
jgi:parvulin-like peptidyl-prolyl isomerase